MEAAAARGATSRGRIAWTMLCQAGPPALLVILFIAPWDSAWLGFWMMGALAAAISALGLTVRLVVRSVRRSRGARMPYLEWQTMTRPLLTIAIVASAAGVAALFEAEAGRYVDGLIAQLQQSCKTDRCLAAPAGWTTRRGHAFNRHARWSFTYVTDPSHRQFALFVHKRTEQELCIYGSASGVVRFNAIQCIGHGRLPEEFRT